MHDGGIFCDLAKAFNCVIKEILLAKLHLCWIWAVCLDWFRSYLTNIRQKVEVKSPSSAQNVFCDWSTLKDGNPQESILGMLLFIIHINDLSLRIHSVSKPILFADDSFWYD